MTDDGWQEARPRRRGRDKLQNQSNGTSPRIQSSRPLPPATKSNARPGSTPSANSTGKKALASSLEPATDSAPASPSSATRPPSSPGAFSWAGAVKSKSPPTEPLSLSLETDPAADSRARSTSQGPSQRRGKTASTKHTFNDTPAQSSTANKKAPESPPVVSPEPAPMPETRNRRRSYVRRPSSTPQAESTALATVPVERVEWADRAMEYADNYQSLLSAVTRAGFHLHLTQIDDRIYSLFRKTFPELNVINLDMELFCDEFFKLEWAHMLSFLAKDLPDMAEQTIVRLRANELYANDNIMMVSRGQFYAIEIARTREGHNAEFIRLAAVKELEDEEEATD